jgi:hypothetical protein
MQKGSGCRAVGAFSLCFYYSDLVLYNDPGVIIGQDVFEHFGF